MEQIIMVTLGAYVAFLAIMSHVAYKIYLKRFIKL
ncbi:hypothetical protein HNP89_001974 [Methanococcus maripaludis]|uniref:Uncharacterized protein n=1 Tax=Methanococcus maripaludis TaxID=39152 RepID=A0A7J9PD19_METMI|nr:hypothetical protein [Methanococcus maripaludis]MBA2861132.1 hypothetical protein [Methanococcus maripaludis]MBM7410171.1 hypothetical protein [Methanococcus maripaludis]MBP2220373.1 hypothetical protein [Methanococcus maripaludis]